MSEDEFNSEGKDYMTFSIVNISLSATFQFYSLIQDLKCTIAILD